MKSFYTLESGVPGVRLATPADEGEIFGLLLMLHAENAFFGLNRDKVRAGIQWATRRQGGIIFCIDQGPRIVATLGMGIAVDWYSDDEYLLEKWNYVHPEYRRGTDYARKLIEQSKWSSDWFKAQGDNMPFQCGIISTIRTEAKVRLYARHLLCVGANFLYGHTPRRDDKVQTELRQIEELNRRRTDDGRREIDPTVKTILRVSQREEDHVR